MSKYVLMSATFLLQAGAGCHAVRLGASECVTWAPMRGRLGNQFVGLADALLEAEMCGRPCVFSSLAGRQQFESLFDLPEIIHVSDHLANDPGVNQSYWCQMAISHNGFHNGLWAVPGPLNFTKTMFNKHLSPLLKRPLDDGVYGDGALIVHLRGGDIMGRQDSFYMPAPCAFYQHVIEHGNNGNAFQRVSVISDDAEHPCLDMISQTAANMRTNAIFNTLVVVPDVSNSDISSSRANSQYTRVSPEDDFMFLVSGTSIAMSASSTFGLSGVAMNPHDKVDIFMPTFSGEPMCCDGNFDPDRLVELCSVGQHSKIYEMPYPHGYSSRPSFLAEFAMDTSTRIHDCTSPVEQARDSTTP